MTNRYSVKRVGYRHATTVIPVDSYRRVALLALQHSLTSPAEAQVIELETLLLDEALDEA